MRLRPRWPCAQGFCQRNKLRAAPVGVAP